MRSTSRCAYLHLKIAIVGISGTQTVFKIISIELELSRAAVSGAIAQVDLARMLTGEEMHNLKPTAGLMRWNDLLMRVTVLLRRWGTNSTLCQIWETIR